jgi:hypothetical protein
MSATISYPLSRRNSGKTISVGPIFYSPLSVTVSPRTRFLNLTKAAFSPRRKMEWKWMKNTAFAFAIAGVLAASALLYAGRQAQKATTYSAMTELAAARITGPGDMQATVAALGRAAEKDVLIRQQRLDNLLQAEGLSGWQRAAFSVTQYMSYGPMSRQEAMALERQQLAMARDALDRCETASTRHATKGTRDLAQN